MSAGRVVTLTFSPALDVATSVNAITPSSKLRCDHSSEEPGGGGINVARVAQRLGSDVVAVAPLSGDNGNKVAEQLAAEGITVERVAADHTIRQSFSVTEESTGRQYRFVLPPPPLGADDADRCVRAVSDLGIRAGCVVVSGSIAIPDVGSALTSIVDHVTPTPVLIDTSGDALAAALTSGATLIKPSARELAELVGRQLDTEDDITSAALETIRSSNVGALLVSIGPGGAVLVTNQRQSVRFRAPTVRVRSTIGAGDSLVAGIATGLANGDDLIDAIRLGIAAGTATVMTDGTELCDAAVARSLLPLVIVDS